MSTLSKYLSSFVGGLKANRISARTLSTLELPPPVQTGGMPLTEALKLRHSEREFSATVLPSQLLSNLLWSACGINRPETGGRTAPSALNAQEVDVYVALASGVFIYDASAHALRQVAQLDARRVTGYQDFVDHAPVDLVYVADCAHVPSWSESQQLLFSGASAGANGAKRLPLCGERRPRERRARLVRPGIAQRRPESERRRARAPGANRRLPRR